MTSSFSPSPFKSVSGLAMLASVGAHIVFFTGSALLSAPAPEQPEKLRVVRLQRQAQNPRSQSPKDPNALLPPPPELPPKGQSSLAGLPSLKPNAQAFRQPSTVPPKADVQTLARQEQALRQELFLRQQQQKIREQQKIIQAQQKAAADQQKAAIARQEAFQKAEEERNKNKVGANPLTDDNPQREWRVGAGDGQIPPIVAAGQSPNFGQSQDGFSIGPAPADLKNQGVNSGSNASPSLNAGDATENLSKTGKKATSLFTWLNKVAVATTGEVPKSKIIEQQLTLPSDAVPAKDGDNAVEVRTFVSAEGEKQFTEIISESGQVSVDRAAIEAVKKYEPMESERGKALVFRYSFQPGSPATGTTSPEQPSQTTPSEQKATSQDTEPVESPDAKEQKENNGEEKKKTEEDKKKAEEDKKSAEKDAKPQEDGDETDESTSSKPEAVNSQDKKAVTPPAKSDSAGGAESQKNPEPLAPTPDPQTSPTESSKPSPEPPQSEKKSGDKEETSVPSSESQPSSEEENPIKSLNLDSLQKK